MTDDIATPATEGEVQDVVRAARTEATPLEIRGGGTRSGLGRPTNADRTLSMAGLSGITLYEPGSMTMVAKAGTPLAEIEAAVDAENQRLAFEPTDHRALYGTTGEPTIGAVAACNISGPRRVQAGAFRDFLLGVRVVTGEGEAIKSGGRVMKNVTGYDLVKLICGSHGTLGVISEVSFKVMPKPEATSVLLIEGLGDERAVAALSTALTTPYDVSGAAHLPKGVDGAPVTMIRLEGLEPSVAYRADKLRERLSAYGDIAIESDPVRTAAGWAYIRDARNLADGDGAIWRLSLKPSDGPKLVATLRDQIDVIGAFYDWGGGLVWLKTSDMGDAGAGAIRGALASAGGHATLIRASDAIRSSVPVFQPEVDAISRLSAGLRAKFDPAGILNPKLMSAI